MPAAMPPIRIGLLLPSTNVTFETELPMLLARHPDACFTFHSSRVRLHAGTEDSCPEPRPALPLLTRNRAARLTVVGSSSPRRSTAEDTRRARHQQQRRCVAELLDASCQVLLDGCLDPLPACGPGARHGTVAAIREQVSTGAAGPVVLTSAEALLEALQSLGARRIAVVLPSLLPLAEQVVASLAAEQLEVTAWVALNEADATAAACIAGSRVLAALRRLDLTQADAVLLSPEGQMPSLPLIQLAESEFGIPVVSAITAAAFTLLCRLHLPTVLPDAGRLLR